MKAPEPRRRPPLAERDRLLLMAQLADKFTALQIARKSYMISRLWAWASRIKWHPHLRVPVPQYLTHRDP